MFSPDRYLPDPAAFGLLVYTLLCGFYMAGLAGAVSHPVGQLVTALTNWIVLRTAFIPVYMDRSRTSSSPGRAAFM